MASKSPSAFTISVTASSAVLWVLIAALGTYWVSTSLNVKAAYTEAGIEVEFGLKNGGCVLHHEE